MAEIVFLGSGGGRIILDRQVLATGGFRINSQHLKMHVDPGPGGFLKSLQHKQDPVELDALFCSHAHIDHCNDVNMMIEGMNYGSYGKKRGILLGSESVINGYQNFEKQVDEYFKLMLKECWAMKPGESYEFSELKKSDPHKTHHKHASLKAMKTSHEDPSCIGFLLEIEGIKIGYTADTEYFHGIAAQFEGADFMLFNCLRPNDDKLEFHMSVSEVITILNEMVKKPKLAVLTHMGMKFLQAGKETQRKKVQDESGIPALLAEEGLRLDLKEFSAQKRLV